MNIFDREIMALESEIRNLKIQKQRTASQLKTKEFVVPIHFELYKRNNYTIASNKIYYITATPKSNVAPMISVRVDVNGLENRNWWLQEFFDSTRPDYNPEKNLVDYEYMFFIIGSNNQSDWDSLNAGIPVYVDCNFIITCSSELDIDVETRDY